VRLARASAFAVALGGVSACAPVPQAPPESRRPLAEVGRSPFGAWASVDLVAPGEPPVAGEVIAADAESLYLGAPHVLLRVPHRCARRATLEAFEPDRTLVAVWAIAGTLSTLSHGGFLVLSAPVWVITGAVALHSYGRAGRPPADVPTLSAWSRFPQGMPASFPSTVAQIDEVDAVTCRLRAGNRAQ
jgi:hypothetical protein